MKRDTAVGLIARTDRPAADASDYAIVTEFVKTARLPWRDCRPLRIRALIHRRAFVGTRGLKLPLRPVPRPTAGSGDQDRRSSSAGGKMRRPTKEKQFGYETARRLKYRLGTCGDR